MVTNDPALTSAPYRRLRLLVLDRDRWLCQICGPRCTQWATVVDHVVSRADGGNVYDPSNMRAACRACNAWRAKDYGGRRHGRASAGRRENGTPPYRHGWVGVGVADYETRL